MAVNITGIRIFRPNFTGCVWRNCSTLEHNDSLFPRSRRGNCHFLLHQLQRHHFVTAFIGKSEGRPFRRMAADKQLGGKAVVPGVEVFQKSVQQQERDDARQGTSLLEP